VSIFDTYRVVYTTPTGPEATGMPADRATALSIFDDLLSCGKCPKVLGGDVIELPIVDGRRLRVISEKVWIESQAVKR
jgi:hypothetical protein